MTAFAAITLNDGSEDFVFSPRSIDALGVAKLYAPSSSGFDLQPAISLSVKTPKPGGSVARITAKVVIPVGDSSSPPMKIGEMIATMEFVVPKGSTDTMRVGLLALAAAFLATPAVEAAVHDLESIY
jgi:hypothetical protein